MNINVQMNPGFKEVDRSCKRYIVMKGSAGSGKSVDTGAELYPAVDAGSGKKSFVRPKGGCDQQG